MRASLDDALAARSSGVEAEKMGPSELRSTARFFSSPSLPTCSNDMDYKHEDTHAEIADPTADKVSIENSKVQQQVHVSEEDVSRFPLRRAREVSMLTIRTIHSLVISLARQI